MVCSSVVVRADTPETRQPCPRVTCGGPRRGAGPGDAEWPTSPPGPTIGDVTSRSEHDPAVSAALLPRDPAAREVLRQIASHRETAALLDARARRSIQPAQGRQLANRA